jgi:hypothetical protein
MTRCTPDSVIASNPQDRIDFTTAATEITPTNDSHDINVENSPVVAPRRISVCDAFAFTTKKITSAVEWAGS